MKLCGRWSIVELVLCVVLVMVGSLSASGKGIFYVTPGDIPNQGIVLVNHEQEKFKGSDTNGTAVHFFR